MAEGGRIHFTEDAIHSVPSNISNGGGVYSTRQRAPSLSDKRSAKEPDLEDEGDAKLNVDDRDLRKKQIFHGWYLAWLSYQSVGAIYGDIGTSPLYVYSSTFTSTPSYDDLVGALSLIIWTLFLMVTVKYVLIVLRADDEGEGGTFALYSLLSRYANIVKRDPREKTTVKMERVLTSDLRPVSRSARDFIERSRAAQVFLKLVGVFGVSLIMSDGVLTPAQSVLGAIQGLEVATPNISTSTIIGVSCAILVVLFLVQPLGTTKLSSAFAPIVILWLLFNLTFGIYNLAIHDASVLKAFSPWFAGHYLVRNGTEGWKSLGGILLAFTGVEALFADLGAFSRRAIQISWLCFAFPCLLLGYIGQAAYISFDATGTAWTNPFYKTVPPGMFYPSLVIAILAAVVASQAMITATFQLLSQIMKLSYFPQIKTVHTSKVFYGQLYIPMANWLLMIGTVIVTAVYNNTTKLGHAYGVCVILVTFITTTMVAVVALIIWRVHFLIVLFGFLVFGALDGVYLSSALTKVPDGAWFTLCLAIVLSSLFILWRFGKEQQWRAEASDRFSPSHMIMPIDNDSSSASPSTHSFQLTPHFGSAPITPIKGIGIFFDKVGQPSTTPTVFVHFLQKFLAASDVVVFFHLRPLSTPTVPPEDRYTVTRCFTSSESGSTGPPNCFRIIIRHGYTDEVVTRDLGLLVYEQLRNFVIREGAARAQHAAMAMTSSQQEKQPVPSASPTSTPASYTTETALVSSHLRALQLAFEAQTVYIVGKEQMRIKTGTNMFRRVALWVFLWMRENSRSKVQSLNVETERLVEVGFVKDV